MFDLMILWQNEIKIQSMIIRPKFCRSKYTDSVIFILQTNREHILVAHEPGFKCNTELWVVQEISH